MSIIYDALKKTQTNTPETVKETQPPQTNTATGKKPSPVKAIGILLGIVAFGIGLSWLLIKKTDWQLLYKKFTRSRKTTIQKRFKPHAQTTQNWNTPSPKRTQPSAFSQKGDAKFVLEGILLSDNQNTALINGQVCSVGSEINGAKVVAINSLEVTLSYNNEKLVLHNE